MLRTRDPKKKAVEDWVRATAGARAGWLLGRAVGKHLIDATNPIAAEPPVNGVLKYATGERIAG